MIYTKLTTLNEESLISMYESIKDAFVNRDRNSLKKIIQENRIYKGFNDMNIMTYERILEAPLCFIFNDRIYEVRLNNISEISFLHVYEIEKQKNKLARLMNYETAIRKQAARI